MRGIERRFHSLFFCVVEWFVIDWFSCRLAFNSLAAIRERSWSFQVVWCYALRGVPWALGNADRRVPYTCSTCGARFGCKYLSAQLNKNHPLECLRHMATQTGGHNTRSEVKQVGHLGCSIQLLHSQSKTSASYHVRRVVNFAVIGTSIASATCCTENSTICSPSIPQPKDKS